MINLEKKLINSKMIKYSENSRKSYLTKVVMCSFFILLFHIKSIAQCSTPYQDDGIYCTNDVFNNSTGMWDHIPNHTVCSDGDPNNGVEICQYNLGCLQAPLPVKLIEFKGTVQMSEVQLEWVTNDELDNQGFEVQKSTSGIDWLIIGFVEGAGTNNRINEYQYQDRNLSAGITYYRLKQIDFDGAFEYSKVIAADYNNSVGSICVFPNPSNGLIKLQMNTLLSQKVNIRISDSLGRIIWEKELIANETDFRQEFEIRGNGLYLVTAQIEDEIYFERIVVIDGK